MQYGVMLKKCAAGLPVGRTIPSRAERARRAEPEIYGGTTALAVGPP